MPAQVHGEALVLIIPPVGKLGAIVKTRLMSRWTAPSPPETTDAVGGYQDVVPLKQVPANFRTPSKSHASQSNQLAWKPRIFSLAGSHQSRGNRRL